MKKQQAAWFLVTILAALARAPAAMGGLPIYIEDNHAGSFYWLAQHLDLDQPCTLIHFDAHSDASAIFDSDNLRSALRNTASMEERQRLLERMRQIGAVQCFSWIEPLMPAPIARVIWVAGEKLSAIEIKQQRRRAIALLDGHLEAAPRRSGSFRDRYLVCDFENVAANLDSVTPLIATIDLDYFAGVVTTEKEAAFSRIWNFIIEQPNLRAITIAISRPYLSTEAEANQLVELALKAALSIPTAEIEFEPFLSVANDHSARAEQFRKVGAALPAYDVTQSPEPFRAMILSERNRITVKDDRQRWENLLGSWEEEAPQLFLAVKDTQLSTDGVWRVPADQPAEVELVAEPWLRKPTEVEWFALIPKYACCNVSNLSSGQVGFVANAAPRPVWTEVRLPYSELTLSITKLDQYFEPHLHCGSLRLHARAKVDGRIRETPITELRRFVGSGFRAAITEQFGLPYLFGSGRLTDGTNTGPETNLGADCANFIVFALRREGRRIPWSDPKGLRAQLDRIGSSLHPGEARLTTSNLQRGMIVDLGTHVAAVMVDRSPLGVLDENDLVAHQLKGIPELLALGELLRNRKKDSFDLLQLPAATSTTLLFGGDVMLGRSFTKKIMDGIDPFSGIQSLLSSCSFAVANLESTISELRSSTESKKYSFRAPPISAKSLARAGFRVMGLANNHALDFGQQAASDCISNLAQEKIESVGIGSTIDQASLPKIFTLPNENKIGLLAIDDLGSKGVPGAELAMGSDRMRLKDAITKAREQANFVVCLVHWGIENTSVVTERQRELGRWLIREGVDAVIGSHPHCLQPLDFYHGCPIAYSLGNLVFDGAPTVASWNRSALLEIGLKEGGNVSLVRSISIVLKEGLPQIPADHKNALWSSDHSGPGVAVDQGP